MTALFGPGLVRYDGAPVRVVRFVCTGTTGSAERGREKVTHEPALFARFHAEQAPDGQWRWTGVDDGANYLDGGNNLQSPRGLRRLIRTGEAEEVRLRYRFKCEKCTRETPVRRDRIDALLNGIVANVPPVDADDVWELDAVLLEAATRR
jgi:hypothetical protein